jgi:hypothetical protein
VNAALLQGAAESMSRAIFTVCSLASLLVALGSYRGLSSRSAELGTMILCDRGVSKRGTWLWFKVRRALMRLAALHLQRVPIRSP